MKKIKKLHIKIFLCLFLSFFAGASFFMPVIQNAHQKNFRYLLMLSSFKRPIFLSGQIYRFLNQSYQNFDISVSIKGTPNDYGFASTFSREFEKFKKTGKVSVRFDDNGPQLSNLLDTVRHVDLNKYDYFCKIDDDDWYAPDYMSEVNKNLNLIPKEKRTFSSSSYHDGLILTETLEKTSLWKNATGLTGPTLCFSQKLIELALRIEKNPELVAKYIPSEGTWTFKFNEDRFLDALARNLGPHIQRHSPYPTVIYGWQYRSVTRNQNYVK